MADRANGSVALWPLLGTCARLILGGVLVVAGALKVGDPDASVRAVRAYQLLPDVLERSIGYGLPLLELAVGVLLLAGAATRLAAVASALLLLTFVVGVSSAWARGLQIECGCFGGGGAAQGDQSGAYLVELARDVGLLALSAWLVLWPRTRWSVDGWVLSGPGEGADRNVPTGASR